MIRAAVERAFDRQPPPPITPRQVEVLRAGRIFSFQHKEGSRDLGRVARQAPGGSAAPQQRAA